MNRETRTDLLLILLLKFLLLLACLMFENHIMHAEGCKWMSTQSCINCLAEVKPSTDRVGPLVVIGLLNDLVQWRKWKVLPTLSYQVYYLFTLALS